MRTTTRHAHRTWLSVIVLLVTMTCGPGSPGAAENGGVNVTVKEWELKPAQLQVKAGTVTFLVKNSGTIEHDFAVEGVGKLDTLTAGESKSLTLKLAPGTYTILCTLSGHKEAGMHGTLTVAP